MRRAVSDLIKEALGGGDEVMAIKGGGQGSHRQALGRERDAFAKFARVAVDRAKSVLPEVEELCMIVVRNNRRT